MTMKSGISRIGDKLGSIEAWYASQPDSCIGGSEVPKIVGPETQSARLDPICLERHRLIAANKRDSRAATFDMLRTRVLSEMRDKGFRTIAVTSPVPGCGKTTVAINLALSIVQQTAPEVLLADFDLRRPKIGQYLGLATEFDLSDYLEGRTSLFAAMVNPGIPRLLVLPNKQAYLNAAEILTTPEVQALVDALKIEDTDRVSIFDLPPVLPTDDAIAFLPQVDCVLLVVADGSTTRADLEESLRLLEGNEVLGVVLNKSEGKIRQYY